MVAQGHEKEVALGSTGSESTGSLCSANHGMGDEVSQLSATTLSAVPITSQTHHQGWLLCCITCQ